MKRGANLRATDTDRTKEESQILSFLRSINTPQMKMQANLHASVRTVYPGKATLLCRCRRLFFQRSAMTGAQHEGGGERDLGGKKMKGS